MGNKAGGKGKKIGRNVAKCSKYRAAGRREKNKARKQLKIQKELAKKKVISE